MSVEQWSPTSGQWRSMPVTRVGAQHELGFPTISGSDVARYGAGTTGVVAMADGLRWVWNHSKGAWELFKDLTQTRKRKKGAKRHTRKKAGKGKPKRKANPDADHKRKKRQVRTPMVNHSKVYDQSTGRKAKKRTASKKIKKRKTSKLKKLIKDVKRLKKDKGSCSYYTGNVVHPYICSQARNFQLNALNTLNTGRKVIYQFTSHWDVSTIEAALEKGRAQDKSLIDANDTTSNPKFQVSCSDTWEMRNMSLHDCHVQYVEFGVKTETATQPLDDLMAYNVDHGYGNYTVQAGEAPTATTGGIYRHAFSGNDNMQQKFLSHIGKGEYFKQIGKVHTVRLQPGDILTLRRKNSFKYACEENDRNSDYYKKFMGGFIVSCHGSIVTDSANVRETGFSDHQLNGFLRAQINFKIDNGLSHDLMDWTATALPTMTTQEEPKKDHKYVSA